MAITKNPLIRYKILDQCFRNPGKRFFIEDLIAECNSILYELDQHHAGISRRQILMDISFMESSEGWSIELIRSRFGRKVYYRYADLNYSINGMPLNAVEIDQLKSALQILDQFNGMPQFAWMNELLAKLQQGIRTNTSEPIMAFDSNQYLKGIENLGLLFNAITYKIPLKIKYKDFKSEAAYDLIFHPYYLKQYNNRWFLFGFNPERNNYHWNLGIDRILFINETTIPFVDSVTDWSEYFEDIIGVTKPNDSQIENVRLIFKNETTKYIINKPLHGSQRTKFLDEKELQVDLELIVNYELQSLILSFGDNVKVVYPEHLSSFIKNKLISALNLYK